MFAKLRLTIALGVLTLSAANLKSQDNSQIIVGAPFLTITPDARAAGFGDQGAATTPDNNSQFWNPAKYVFASYKGGASYSFTPWMKNVSDGISLHNLAGFYKIDNKQAVSGSIRYFSIGDIPLTDEFGNQTTVVKPNEFAIDLGYSRKLSEYLSAAVEFRFLRSDLTGGNSIPTIDGSTIETKSATSFAADVALYYSRVLASNNSFAFGLNISNIGPKISYSNNADKMFIPTNLRVGGRYTFALGETSKLSALLETTKLLVPTPKYENGVNVNANKGVIEGIFSSFGDAPGGFSEEMKEFTYSIGAELSLKDMIMARTGYFHESEMKGNRKFITFGLGGKYNIFEFNASYLVPTTSGSSSPLNNTFRFSVGVQL